MMKLLALDASTEACSVAIKTADSTAHIFEVCPQSHSLVLLPQIDKLLSEQHVTLAELDGLVFGQGPGSFTGVRIGVGVAQGLAFAAELPVVGVSTLQAMAQQAYEQTNVTQVVAMIDARMSEVYLGCYQLDNSGMMQAVMNDTVLSPSAAVEKVLSLGWQSFMGVGTGWQAYQQTLSQLPAQFSEQPILYPHAQYMLPLGLAKFANGEGSPAELAQPSYVRDTVSWKKLPGRD